MKTADAILFALENLSSRRLRTGLSTLGMMFGVAAVIAMLSIGAGAERRAMAMIERLGVRNVLIKSEGRGAKTAAPRREPGATPERGRDGELLICSLCPWYAARIRLADVFAPRRQHLDLRPNINASSERGAYP